jgi:aminomethyltransferase
MPLYGHELTETIDPLTAGLEFAVKLDKPDFLGKAALAEIAKKIDRRKRIGLELAGKRIAREGATVMQGEQAVGVVTSGTFSPTLDRSIAMAYVEPQVAATGTSLEVDIRGKREIASVVALPFYKRQR